MAACWRELASFRDEVEIHVLAYGSSVVDDIVFDASVMSGVDHRLLNPSEQNDTQLISRLVWEQEPDVLVLPGWLSPSYRALSRDKRAKNVKLIMTLDNPWLGNWRQRLARLKVGRYIDRMDAIAVPGERAWQYARNLGMPEERIWRCLYGIDAQAFEPVYEMRCGNGEPWPRRFIFTGRYAEVKAFDKLVAGYQAYRSSVEDPWPLTCCGKGPMEELAQSVEGIEDLGFVQPTNLPGIYADHGVFILPSRYEPWALVIVEACAAGFPIICTNACGSAVELVRSHYNGQLIATDSVQQLTKAMVWMHENYELLPEMGRRSQQLAEPYSAQMWARRWLAMLESLTD